jgi:hypothetical protein
MGRQAWWATALKYIKAGIVIFNACYLHRCGAVTGRCENG